jgi:RNA polymerase sigma factor (sigma-70 family)
MAMFDREIVDSIVEGDPAGLGAAYDQYASGLYAYCRSLLAEPADAADAVQDTFIIAAAKVSGLREPERLRSWLYSVARNECHGRLRAKAMAAPLNEAAEMIEDVADLGEDVEQAELRDLVWAALSGLNPGEREIIELNLRHELDGADLADALGVPRNQAHALASRARSQFEASLGVLLVARYGQEYCAELATILDGWDGELTVLIRKRVNRHIDKCDICGERKREELSPAMLLGLLPVAMLPVGLRQEVMHLVSDVSPEAEDYRNEVTDRAGPFNSAGFPLQIAPLAAPRSQISYAMAAVIGVAALAVIGGVMFLLLSGGGSPSAAGDSSPLPAPGPAAGAPAASQSADPAPSSSTKPGLTTPSLIAPIPAAGAPILPTPLPTKTTAKATAKATTKAPTKAPTTTPTTPKSTTPTTPVSTTPTTPVSTTPTTPVSTTPTTPVSTTPTTPVSTTPTTPDSTTPTTPTDTDTSSSTPTDTTSPTPSITTTLVSIIGEL